jgi:hypothetical protein
MQWQEISAMRSGGTNVLAANTNTNTNITLENGKYHLLPKFIVLMV